MAEPKKADKAPGGKGGGAAAARRAGPRAAQGRQGRARDGHSGAAGQAGQRQRNGAAPDARALPDRGGPGHDEGARLRQSVPGAAAREGRDQHGGGRGQGEREGAGLRHRGPAGDLGPEADHHPGQEVDRQLQAARERADRLQGHAARAAHVRVPGPARQRGAAAGAGLQGRAPQGLRRPRQLQHGTQGADHLPRDRVRQGGQGPRHGHHDGDDRADRRGSEGPLDAPGCAVPDAEA